jgi:Holliday junction resolvase RusA-like endonuclease
MVEDVCVDADIIADDSMIASMFSVKLYDDNPRTTFIITTIKGGNAIESNTYEE